MSRTQKVIPPANKISLLFDVKLLRPACVLLQSVYGFGQFNGFMQTHFEDWLVAPTKDMKVITGTREEWELWAKKIAEIRKKEKGR